MTLDARTTEDSTARTRPKLLRWQVSSADPAAWRPFTILAGIGLAAVVAMAVFGLPPLDLHTPLHHAGIMDPLCGGTRAVRLAAMGNVSESLVYNPLGVVVLLAFVAMVVRAAVGLATHRWYSVGIGWTRRRAWIASLIVIGLVVALEIRQQSIAPLLMAR